MPENHYQIDPDEYDNTVLYVYPAKQLRMEGHPEVQHHLVLHRTGENVWVKIKHPLGETTIKVNQKVFREAVQEYLTEL